MHTFPLLITGFRAVFSSSGAEKLLEYFSSATLSLNADGSGYGTTPKPALLYSDAVFVDSPSTQRPATLISALPPRVISAHSAAVTVMVLWAVALGVVAVLMTKPSLKICLLGIIYRVKPPVD